MTHGRGPDARELAFSREQRALLAVYEIEHAVAKAFDELLAAQAQVLEQGEQPRQPHFGPLKESWQMRRGEAFWDRPPAEPTPAGVPPGQGVPRRTHVWEPE